ncbi:SIS domain-containing protein [Candidatus Nitrosarchaeum limnium]|uniref:Putative bifunctional phosphoglucose/phosphomannose isomerase n=1 Tax=Candidatus Nitrosarchaeum limnium BG20 TaxID=859192 RepID=S2ERY4_9ARCH|nr:SIS domain-containing protein [Candidatus Nitrosarchaeum limnium]EPA05179.1 putative bifunctional phosphoglucose/phosphomannose isomerase [Candidatus Nitrosarchaeum limnium BG20]
MITLSDLKKFDQKGMYKIYDQWPELAKKSYESNYDEVIFNEINHIVFAGVGGSGAVGDLLSSILSKSNLHVTLVKGYLLPKTIDKNTLVIVTSVSGDSIETMTVLESASKQTCSILVFSSGGKMEKFCKQNKINFRKIEYVHSPRASLIKYIYSILKILRPILPITHDEIIESINELKIIKHNISSNNLSDSNHSLELAAWISGIPLIYYPHGLQSAAIRFKSSLQENAKSHVIIEDVIEASHNGIVAWEKISIVQPILIRGQDDYIKTKERWIIIKKYLTKKNIDFKEIESVSGNILTKLVTLIYLLDYASIYKAVLDKIDPSPVLAIDYVKKNI